MNLYYITYYYPPFARARSRKLFSRYLSEAGYNITVLTTVHGRHIQRPPAGRSSGETVRRIAEPIPGVYLTPFFLTNFIACPFFSWARKVRMFLARQSLPWGWILAVYPPMSDLTAAFAVHTQTSFPLAVDFRDDLLEGYHHRYFGPRMALNRTRVKKILNAASVVSTATPAIADSLGKRYGTSGDKMVSVLNGYGTTWHVDHGQREKNRLRIVYAGAATEAQKPEVLVHAFRQLEKADPRSASKIDIAYFCPQSFHFKNRLAHLFGGSVRYGGFLPFDQVREEMVNADLLFLSLSGNRYAYAFPAKLADYVNAEKPVLASLPEGFAKRLITEKGLGMTVEAGNSDALSETLARIAKDPEILDAYRRNVIAVKDEFSMEHQVTKLAERLKSY